MSNLTPELTVKVAHGCGHIALPMPTKYGVKFMWGERPADFMPRPELRYEFDVCQVCAAQGGTNWTI